VREPPAKRSRASRLSWLAASAIVPLVAVLLLAATAIEESFDQPRLPCPLYPNAVVSYAAVVHEACPLEPGDVILELRESPGVVAIDSSADVERLLATRRAADLLIRSPDKTSEDRVSIQTLTLSWEAAYSQLAASAGLAVLLLVFVLLTAVRADVPASLPFAVIYSSIGVLIVGAVAGWISSRAYPVTSLARWALPAAIAHLAFVFPRPREVTLRVPQVRIVPYWIAGGLFLLEFDAAYRGSASTMLLLQRIGLAAIATTGGLLCLSSWLSMRESPSRIARGQARVFLQGLAGLAAVAFLVGRFEGPGGALTAVTLTAAISPLPLGYAIASHHLFGFDTAWRKSISHIVYLSVWSGFFFLGVVAFQDRLPLPAWLRNPVVMYIGVYAVLAPLDGLRDLLRRFIERTIQPGARIWARLSEGRASQLAHLRDAESIARTAVALAIEGTPGAAASLFRGDGSSFRLSHASGAGACKDPEIAARAFQMSGTTDVVDVNRVDTIEPETSSVCDAGVEVIVPIATDNFVHGLLLVCPARQGRLHPAARIAWLRLISLHAAAALETVRLTEQLRVAEEFAVRGRMHAELAHEIGKPLGTLEMLARKLARDESDPGEVRSRAASIAVLSEQLRDIVRGVLRAGRDPERIEVARLIERACTEIANVHGSGQVVVLPIPALPPLGRDAQAVGRALTNLIDNAIRASDPGGPVEVGASADDGWIEIQISDRGCGVAPDDLSRVFDAFVTLRPGGNGLGLTISRQIVEQVGGTLTLESELGSGTVARLRLPIGS
jgi:signal transduction histidine kinase